ncbi:MAG: hypothetical protein AAF211_26580, partial [Myxococcota bacterium]
MRGLVAILLACAEVGVPATPSQPLDQPPVVVAFDVERLALVPGADRALAFRLDRPENLGATARLENLPEGVPGPAPVELGPDDPAGIFSVEVPEDVPFGTATLARVVVEVDGAEPVTRELPCFVLDRDGQTPFAGLRQARLSLGPGVHEVSDMAVDGFGRVLVGGTHDGVGWLVRFLPSGFLDVSFGESGKVRLSGIPGRLLSRPGGRAVLEVAGSGPRRLEVFDDSGQSDTVTFADGRLTLGGPDVIELLWAEDGIVVVDDTSVQTVGLDGAMRFRIDVDETPFVRFGAASLTLGDGILLGGPTGEERYVVERRSLADGSRDDGFAPEWSLSAPPGPLGEVFALDFSTPLGFALG